MIFKTLWFASAAYACFDPANKPIPHAPHFLQQLANQNATFFTCLDLFEGQGVDIRETQAWRKDRASGVKSPIAYTITVQGRDQAGQPTVLAIDYDLRRHAYTCGEPSHVLYRCGGF